MVRIHGWIAARKSSPVNPTEEVDNDYKMKMLMLRNPSFTSSSSSSTSSTSSDGEGVGRTVVVGLKLDLQSRELLTWALVKVAQPGDRVIALHIINKNDGNSSLLSLVKAFDSLLEVYDGFCNLKQLDLKLKICRGSSVRKFLVREAKAYFASKVIVGTSRNHHGIRPFSTSVAKYCARKLPTDCCVLAVNNAKLVFQRESTVTSISGSRGDEDEGCRTNFRGLIHRTLSKKSTKLLTNVPFNQQGHPRDFLKSNLTKSKTLPKHSCSVCATESESLQRRSTQSADRNLNDEAVDNSLALVPVQTLEGTSSSVSLLMRELPHLKSGWPLLRRAILPHRQASLGSIKELSVVQWEMPVANHHCSAAVHPSHQPTSQDHHEDGSSSLDGESGAIVLLGNDSTSLPSSPNRGPKNLPEEFEFLREKYSSTCQLFEYRELQSATSNFMPENLIGKGGSSQVYKGRLPDGKELAVKILNPSEDVVKEFVMEIEIINALNHKNVISLFGFCFEENNLLMVYDFLSRGSLEENLHGDKGKPVFGWEERYKVAMGVAEALDYLHNYSAQPVIHRDVKSSNILLSDDFKPQLSDFGFAMWASSSTVNITCIDVAGTFGYLAPEYFMYGKVTDKIDVYAFGVVLLELLSGRKPISSDHPKGQESLVMWAKPILDGGNVSQLLDPSFGDNYDQDEMERMVIAATLCIRRSPRTRPRMSLVSKLLHGDPEVTKWSRVQVSASEELDGLDDEVFSPRNIQSHLNLALLDVEDDSISVSSIDQSVSLEDYLQGRWSRSSSFD